MSKLETNNKFRFSDCVGLIDNLLAHLPATEMTDLLRTSSDRERALLKFVQTNAEDYYMHSAMNYQIKRLGGVKRLPYGHQRFSLKQISKLFGLRIKNF